MLREIIFLSVIIYVQGNLGYFEDIDINDDEVSEAVDIAAEALSKKLYGSYHFKLIKTTHAQKEIVGGTNFKIDVIVAMTNCMKKEVPWKEIDRCEIQTSKDLEVESTLDAGIYKKCTLVIYRSIQDEITLITSACVNVSSDEV